MAIRSWKRLSDSLAEDAKWFTAKDINHIVVPFVWYTVFSCSTVGITFDKSTVEKLNLSKSFPPQKEMQLKLNQAWNILEKVNMTHQTKKPKSLPSPDHVRRCSKARFLRQRQSLSQHRRTCVAPNSLQKNSLTTSQVRVIIPGSSRLRLPPRPTPCKPPHNLIHDHRTSHPETPRCLSRPKIYAASQTTSQFDFQVKPVTTYILIRDELIADSKTSFEHLHLHRN